MESEIRGRKKGNEAYNWLASRLVVKENEANNKRICSHFDTSTCQSTKLFSLKNFFYSSFGESSIQFSFKKSYFSEVFLGQFRKLRTLQWNGAEVGIMKESRNVEPLSFLPDELTYFMSKVSARLTFPLSRNKSQNSRPIFYL